MLDPLTLQVFTVLLLATLVRSTFGFGEALVAVPLLALIIPVEVAAPLAALVSITVAAVVLLRDWSEVQGGSAGWLVLSTLPGVPLGLLLLTRLAETWVKLILGALIILFSAYSLWNRRPILFRNDNWAWLFGFMAGILGGAYGMNGPPLVVYGTMRSWSPAQFRATLQGYFLPASLVVMAGYWLAGLWTPQVTQLYLWSLPVILPAIFLGQKIHQRIPVHLFIVLIHSSLILIGAALVLQASGLLPSRS